MNISARFEINLAVLFRKTKNGNKSRPVFPGGAKQFFQTYLSFAVLGVNAGCAWGAGCM